MSGGSNDGGYNPHDCPACEGNGKIDLIFAEGTAESTSTSYQPGADCPLCDGSGANPSAPK